MASGTESVSVRGGYPIWIHEMLVGEHQHSGDVALTTPRAAALKTQQHRGQPGRVTEPPEHTVPTYLSTPCSVALLVRFCWLNQA